MGQRTMQQRTMDQVATTFRLLSDAAKDGAPCPTNKTLAPLLGCGEARASQMVQILEGMGAVEVQRSPQSRVIRIPATGERTSGPWYDAEAAAAGLVLPIPEQKIANLAQPSLRDLQCDPNAALRPAPTRDPCGRCYIPGFKGCEHWAPFIPGPNQLPVPPSREDARRKNINARWS
jgi:hypothetical protein